MNLSNPEAKISQIVKINRADRWLVYQRLQQLGIACQCFTNKPLRVELSSTKDAIQLWSVVKQVDSSRTELIGWLDSCWQINSY
ncbi:MAG: hypothetical protein QNJ38_12285 [Prochloraceae cyanobacterium]|nr:hypothetical protein [Prochloraceae cyanobacterium]